MLITGHRVFFKSLLLKARYSVPQLLDQLYLAIKQGFHLVDDLVLLLRGQGRLADLQGVQQLEVR